jgi:hypothetical protein
MQEVFHIRKRIINLINKEEFKIIAKAIKKWEVIIFCAGKDMKLIHRNLRKIMKNNYVFNANNIAILKCLDVITLIIKRLQKFAQNNSSAKVATIKVENL